MGVWEELDAIIEDYDESTSDIIDSEHTGRRAVEALERIREIVDEKVRGEGK